MLSSMNQSQIQFNKTMKKMLLIPVLFVVLFIAGCDAPFHTVIESSDMKVYHVEEQYGKYEMWITDASGQGWVLVSDTKYNVGDRVKITTQTK